MRALIQRVTSASVTIDQRVKSAIGPGLLILLGVETADEPSDGDWLARKIAQLRLFDDGEGKMNLSLLDTGGQALVVSQFTLHARTRKGTRPSYDRAARPEQAIPLYEGFVAALEREIGQTVGTGEFGAMMAVSLVNDGPVTLMLDSRLRE
ncbi:MAG: D-tyrosyl-tRNA(Tyr) deacylase [Verrucomicrobiales bacterium]|nr:D-tyrosyl-tRNA(Tyr) deacylase [Verrucomicrobiales bacterium]